MPAPRLDACVRGHPFDEAAMERADGLGRQCGLCKHLWAIHQQRVARSSLVLLRHQHRCPDCRAGRCRAGAELRARLLERVEAFDAFRAAGRNGRRAAL